MAGNKRITHAILAVIATVGLATACGRTVAPLAARPGTQLDPAQQARVIHDPDNTAWTGAVITVSGSSSGAAIHDPDNPYWVANPYRVGPAQVISSTRVIHDPDNPLWTGR